MAAHNQPQAQRTDRSVWWSLAGGIVIWSLHLMIVYPITSLACVRGVFTDTVAGMTQLKLIQLVVTISAALIVTGLLLLALRAWRRTELPAGGGMPTAKGGSHHLIAFVAMLLNGLFLLAILLAFVPIFVLPACG